jgi:hypothetical protein
MNWRYGIVILLASALTSGTAAGQNKNPITRALPADPGRTAHTTPATNSSVRILPQARQVGNPTGPVPNSAPWNRPPQLPQAGQIRDCGTAHPKHC